MKQLFFKVTMTAMFSLILLVVSAQEPQYGIVLDESFENGIPDGWTQESVVGNQQWIVEGGDTMTYPSGAADGKKRLACRNTTRVTNHSVTRLITPVLDVKNLFQPILCFSHAQDQWTGDFDTLRVLYRTAKDGEWIELGSFDKSISKWTKDTLPITASFSNYYQLAFECIDNLGRGVTIDNVIIRSIPTCMPPAFIDVINVKNATAEIIWSKNFDALMYNIKVSDKPIASDLFDNKANIVDTVVDNNVTSLFVSDLQADKEYFVYIQSICSNDFHSDWSKVSSFHTSNVMNIPYNEDFNLGYIANTKSVINEWKFGASEDWTKPYINTDRQPTSLCNYSKDCSNALVFENYNTDIKKTGDSYVILPQICDIDISQLQVSFWAGTAKGMDLIVAIGSNSFDINTFIDIDTVHITENDVFHEYIIPFEEYEGEGAYIALISKKTNSKNSSVVYVDDLKVDFIPKCKKIENIKLSLLKGQDPLLSWSDVKCDEFEILISKTQKDTIKKTADDILIKSDVNSLKLNSLPYWYSGYVYIRAVCSNDSYGDWSEPYHIQMPEVIQNLPDTISFELLDPNTYYIPKNKGYGKINNGLMVFSETMNYPYCYNGLKVNERLSPSSNYALWLFAYEGDNSYVVYPELPYINKISFYSYVKATNIGSKFELGVMKDANDTSSFVPIDTIFPQALWKKHVYLFDEDNTLDGFIAFKINNTSEGFFNQCWVDNFVVEQLPNCIEADDIRVVPTDTSVFISWRNRNGNSEWRVRMSEHYIKYDSLYSQSYNDYIYDTVVHNTEILLGNLLPNNHDYYYSIQSVCGDSTGSWIFPETFKTECSSANGLPYIMNFDGFETGTALSQFPIPCVYTQMISNSIGTVYYPNLSSFRYGGSASLQMSNIDTLVSYFALPKLKEKDWSKLALSFKVYSTSNNNKLEVGIVSDVEDMNTFDKVDDIYILEPNKWQDVYVYFPSQNLKEGNLALRAMQNCLVYIDNLKVDYKEGCPNIRSLRPLEIKDTSAILTWVGDMEDSWEMIASKRTLTQEELTQIIETEGNESVMFVGVVENDTFELKGLEANSVYYVYVRAMCDDFYGDWNDIPCTFTTNCSPYIPDKTVFDFEKFDVYGVPYCWTVGNFNESSYSIPKVSNEWSFNGKYSLKISSNTDGDGMYAILPVFKIDSVKDLEISFWATTTNLYANNKYQKQIKVGVLSDINDLATFTEISQLDIASEPKRYTVSLDEYIGDYMGILGNHIAFVSFDFSKDNVVYIDSVSVNYINECSVPVDFSVSYIDNDSVVVEWRRGFPPYKIILSEQCLEMDSLDNADYLSNNSVSEYVSNTTSLAFSKLESNKSYFMYVSSNCNDDINGYWSPEFSFKTLCPDSYSLPFKEDFDQYVCSGKGCQPECFLSIYTNSVGDDMYDYPHIIDGYGKNSSNAVFLYSEQIHQSYLIFPNLSYDYNKNILVSFDAIGDQSECQRSVVIGFCKRNTLPEDVYKTFMPIDTILLTNVDMQRFVVEVFNKDMANYQLCFTTLYDLNLNLYGYPISGGFYIDNIKIYEKPICNPPINIKLTKELDNDAYIEFDTIDFASKWEVKYKVLYETEFIDSFLWKILILCFPI